MKTRALLTTRLRDQRGAVLVLVAASVVLFLLCAAFVVDIGNARQVARNYQNAADGASLAGAQELDRGQLGAQGAVDFAADYAFQTLGVSYAEVDCSDQQFAGEVPSGLGGAGTPHCYTDSQEQFRVYVTTPWTDSVANGTTLPGGNEPRQINVKVCGNVLTGFARVAGINFIQPCRLATAMSALGTGPCAVCVLEEQAQNALTMSGNGSATVIGSSAWINSNSTQAATNPGNGTFSAQGFYVRGGATGFNPAPTTGAPKISDPAAWLPDPRSLQASGWPDWTTLPVKNSMDVKCQNPGDTVPIDPGIWSSIKVNPSGPNTCDGTNTLRLNPGFYVIRDRFEITTDVNLVADRPGVTIYFACDNFPENPCGPGEHAYFLQTGNGNIDFYASTAPAGHPYNNLLFFFDRNNQSQLNRFSGGGAVTNVTGTIYAPSARFELSGSGNFKSLFVVDMMELTGSGLLNITYNPNEQIPTYLPALIT